MKSCFSCGHCPQCFLRVSVKLWQVCSLEWLFSRVLLSFQLCFALLPFYIYSWIRYLHTGWGCIQGDLKGTLTVCPAVTLACPQSKIEHTYCVSYLRKYFSFTYFNVVLFKSDQLFRCETFVYSIHTNCWLEQFSLSRKCFYSQSHIEFCCSSTVDSTVQVTQKLNGKSLCPGILKTAFTIEANLIFDCIVQNSFCLICILKHYFTYI